MYAVTISDLTHLSCPPFALCGDWPVQILQAPQVHQNPRHGPRRTLALEEGVPLHLQEGGGGQSDSGVGQGVPSTCRAGRGVEEVRVA